MDYKLDFLSKLFQKTSKKALENYVLTRLWHKLDDFDVKIVPQQYINRHEDKYALTDVYFPQVGIHVEVNEPEHYDSEWKVKDDKIRKYEIEKRSGHKLFEIDCRQPLSKLHEDIDEIVEIIKEEVIKAKEKGGFKAWQPNDERSPNYWLDKGSISIEDEVSMTKIEDICTLFNADFSKTKRGFLRRGIVDYPTNKGIGIWWPSDKLRQGWKNELVDNHTIIETHIEEVKKEWHFELLKNTKQVRYVFFYHKDILGFEDYKFKGVYLYDEERSNKVIGTVWKRIATQIDLKMNTYK